MKKTLLSSIIASAAFSYLRTFNSKNVQKNQGNKGLGIKLNDNIFEITYDVFSTIYVFGVFEDIAELEPLFNGLNVTNHK
jgi:hypothetical protein